MFCSPAESMCHVVMVLDFCAPKAQKGRREKMGLGLNLSGTKSLIGQTLLCSTI